jgi:porin
LFATTDSSTTSGFGTLNDGWSWSTEADFQYRLGKLPGGTNVGFIYSWDGDFANFNGRFTFEPGQGVIVPKSNDSWAMYWSGWQYLHTRGDVEGPVNLHAGSPTVQGFGLFWRAGIADNDTVPINWSLSAGLGGMGIIPGREFDTFGIGYYYSNIETDRLTDALGLDDHSYGFEAFYNFAITPAAHLTLDAQVVSSPGPNADTGVILGMRLGLVF